MSGPHHRGTHQARARHLTRAANLNPTTRCWRCNHTLPNCQPHKDGTPAYWTAGHLTDGQIDGPLAPECSTCNYSAGGHLANHNHNPTSEPL